jgi:GTP-binding protein EngB required for normal cell division
MNLLRKTSSCGVGSSPAESGPSVLTKADKLTRMQVLERHAAIRSFFALGEEDRTIVFSAENRTGVEELRGIIEKVVNLTSI